MDPKSIRYSLQIDSEGYPLFDELRIDDEILLKSFFGKIRRLNPGDLRSTLVTECEGETCFVNAFSAPLIAQSIENVSEKNATWIFLGGRKEKVNHSEILEDPWHRFHAWIGEDKIEALLSPKAQAQLLHSLPESYLPSLKPRTFRKATESVNEDTFWSQCYIEGKDGWEMRAPTPVLTEHFKELSHLFKKPSQMLVPGCGRSHDAAFLESQGHIVKALDFSKEALADSQKLYASRKNISWVHDDVFSYLQNSPSSFDAIFEHTIFCAIDPERREEFIEGIASALKQSAIWFGSYFLRTSPGGPPFGITQWELNALTEKHFDIIDWKISPYSATPRKNQELWAVFRKR